MFLAGSIGKSSKRISEIMERTEGVNRRRRKGRFPKAKRLAGVFGKQNSRSRCAHYPQISNSGFVDPPSWLGMAFGSSLATFVLGGFCHSSGHCQVVFEGDTGWCFREIKKSRSCCNKTPSFCFRHPWWMAFIQV